MKFLFICQMAGSVHHGMVLRVYAQARELVALGHDVSMIAAAYSHTRKVQPGKSRFFDSEKIDGIDYYWMPGVKYSTKSSIGRLLSMLVFTFFSSLWAVLKARPGRIDVVVASSPFPTVVYPAVLAARFARSPLVFDIRDLWPLTLKKLGGYSANHAFIMLMQCAEDYACRKSDLITTVLKNGERYLRSRGLRPNRYLYLPNGAIEVVDSDPLADSQLNMFNGLRESGKFIIGYSGAIGLTNALECLVRALPHVYDNVHIVLAGEGEYVERLQLIAAQLDIVSQVHYLGRIRQKQVPTFLGLVDVGFVATRKSTLYRYGASLTKVGEYMLAALPQIYGVGDRGNAVAESGGGIEFVPESEESCAAAIIAMHDLGLEGRRAMGNRGRDWALENYLWSKHIHIFLSRVKQL